MGNRNLPQWDSTLPIRFQLEQLADEPYREFIAKLLPGTPNLLGVRLPLLRQLARQIAKEDWRTYLANAANDTFEETMLQGLVISYAKAEPFELLAHTADFVPKINNWSVCDSFCAGFRLAKREPELVWDFLQPYLASEQEFHCRFGVVMLLDHYCSEQNLERIFLKMDQVRATGYYAKMAVAWNLSMCCAVNPELTLRYFKQNTLDDFTHNKALQKIVESRQIDENVKSVIRTLKRAPDFSR